MEDKGLQRVQGFTLHTGWREYKYRHIHIRIHPDLAPMVSSDGEKWIDLKLTF